MIVREVFDASSRLSVGRIMVRIRAHMENVMKYHESKLSYSMYLLHPMLMQIAYGNQFVVPVHFSDFKPVLMYFGE